MKMINNQKINIELFYAPSLKAEKILFEQEQSKAFKSVNNRLKPQGYDSIQYEKLFDRLESFWKLSSPVKHLEITTTIPLPAFDEVLFLNQIKESYEQILWIKFQKGMSERKYVYYLDFIPLAKRKTGFPIEVSLRKCITQELGISVEQDVLFLEHIKELFSLCLKKDDENISQLCDETIQPNEVKKRIDSIFTRPDCLKIGEKNIVNEQYEPKFRQRCQITRNNSKNKKSNNIKISLLAVQLIILLVAFRSIGRVYARVEGDSMLPTLHHGEEVVVSKNTKKINRFDVIIFQYENDTNYVKRVIGLPGETVQYRNGSLYIDNQKVTDVYSFGDENFSLFEVAGVTSIPENQYLVLGDNRKNSLDSRYYGLIDAADLVGVVKQK